MSVGVNYYVFCWDVIVTRMIHLKHTAEVFLYRIDILKLVIKAVWNVFRDVFKVG